MVKRYFVEIFEWSTNVEIGISHLILIYIVSYSFKQKINFRPSKQLIHFVENVELSCPPIVTN